MAGPRLLDGESIALLASRPGVYVLGREGSGTFYGLYVGRSDTDLKGRLAEHLPGREANAFIRLYAPDRFHFQCTATAYEAYRMECTLFHSAQYPANLFHPDPGRNRDWECPVCGRDTSRVREPILGYAARPGDQQGPHG